MPSSVLRQRVTFGLELLDALARTTAGRPKAWVAPTQKSRAEALLSLIEQDIWPQPAHPYRRMLEIAGWDPGRVRRSIEDAGLQSALERLVDDGVYLRADEIKCRVPLVRRNQRIEFHPPVLDRVRGASVPLGTSGTSGPATKNPFDVAGFELQAAYKGLLLEALGGWHLPIVQYYPAPSAAGIAQLIAMSLAGKPVDAWFCHLPERSSSQARWGLWLRALAIAARLRGVRLCLPITAPIERPMPLVHWLRRHAAGGAVVLSFPGSALRVQAFADAEGVELPRLSWVLGGEPLTARKRQLLEERGHTVYPWYGAVDAGRIAIGCMAPRAPDDMHLLEDRFAAVVPRQPHALEGRLLLTSMASGVHKILLNADTGDTAEISRQPCGCPLEAHGLASHVRRVRSVQKVTLEGLTLPVDVVCELAEDILPSTCGGRADDYQMTEVESGDGITRLRVRVNPQLSVADGAVVEAVHRVLIAAVSGFADMSEILRRADGIEVLREMPRMTRGGKLLSLSSEVERSL